MIVMLTSILQAMSFNSVLDIPTLLMIVLFAAFYAFRKSYYIIYQQSFLLFVYWVHLTVALNFIYIVMTAIPFVNDFIVQHGDHAFVIVIQLLMGQNLDTSIDIGYVGKQKVYFILLMLNLFCCQSYKQAKWANIRFLTKDSDSSSSTLDSLNTYFSLK
jgi:hypothetical protein